MPPGSRRESGGGDGEPPPTAQPAWEELGADGRAKHLLAWLDWIMDNERRLVQLVQAESGKSWGDALLEPTTAVDVIRYATRNAGDWLAPRKVRPHNPLYAGKRLRAHVRPHQLVGVILPWNMPLGMPMLDIPFALAAGAAVLSKPSEITPLAWSRGCCEGSGAPALTAHGAATRTSLPERRGSTLSASLGLMVALTGRPTCRRPADP